MLLEQLSLISIEKLMNYMDVGGFLVFLAKDAGTSCGSLWQPVASESCPLYITLLEESKPGSFYLAGLV